MADHTNLVVRLEKILEHHDAIAAVDDTMPISYFEAHLLHDDGWSSGAGWIDDLDWWRENEPSKFGEVERRYAYENAATKSALLNRLRMIRRKAAAKRYKNTLNEIGADELRVILSALKTPAETPPR